MKIIIILFIVLPGLISSLYTTLDCRLGRQAFNNGLHRKLVTKVQLDGVFVSKETNCSCMLIENIPSGIYVDLHEVRSQESHGGPQVYSTSRIDVEKPEYWSTPHKVYVWHHFTMTTAKTHEFEISIPIHLRYHRPSADHEYVQVALGAPKLFLQCEGSSEKFRGLPGKDALALCDNTKKSNYECEWREIDYVKSGSLDDYVVKMAVPLGNERQSTIVIACTLAFTVSGTAYLVYHICISNQNHDLIALIKSQQKAKSKHERHCSSNNYYRDRRGGTCGSGRSKHEILKEKIKALLSYGAIDKENASPGSGVRKRYK